MTVVALAGLFGLYLMWVKPERKQASAVSTQLTTAQGTLSSAQQSLTEADQAQHSYPHAYKALVNLAEAVPPTDDVPSLLYSIQAAAGSKYVDFNSIQTGDASSSTSSTPAGAVAAGIQALPFTFVFSGSYLDLYHLLDTLDNFTSKNSSGLAVGGRLLTITGATLAPGTGVELQGTISATAYVLPSTSTDTALPGSGAQISSTPPASTGTASNGSTVPITAAVAQTTP
jgi:hypothetical protein